MKTIRKKKLLPIHPGEILMEEFLNPLGISQYKLAKEIHVPARRINEIVHGERAVTVDTALRLSRYFGTSAEFWLNLQTIYALEKEKDKLGEKLNFEIRVLELDSLNKTDKELAQEARRAYQKGLWNRFWTQDEFFKK